MVALSKEQLRQTVYAACGGNTGLPQSFEQILRDAEISVAPDALKNAPDEEKEFTVDRNVTAWTV